MFHKVLLVGNLGRDPEMRYTPSGQAVTNMSVATNRSYTDSSGEKVDETVWFRVSVWGKQAESVHQYLRKGRQVLVEGRMVPDENGNPRIWNRNLTPLAEILGQGADLSSHGADISQFSALRRAAHCC